MTFRTLLGYLEKMTDSELDSDVYVKHPEIGCFMEVDRAWVDEDIMDNDQERVIIQKDNIYLSVD